MSPNQQDQEQRSKGRVSLERPVRLRYRLFQDFIQEVSSNISTGGMFIASGEPREPGSQFEFELTLEDGFSLIKGQAEVVWVRSETRGVGQPAGMGVRFVELERASKTLIAKIVAKLRRKGKQTFDLERDGPEAETRAGEPATGPSEKATAEELQAPPLPTEPKPSEIRPAAEAADEAVEAAGTAAGSTTESRQPKRSWSPGFRFSMLGLAAITAGFLGVWLFHVLYVRPRIEDLEQRIERLSAVGVGGMATTSSVDGTGGSLGSEPASDLSDPRDVIKQWASAWSEQRVDDYLAFYSATFQPSGVTSREEWEDLRRARILRHTGIRVQILLIEETAIDPQQRLFTFVQSYRSDTYVDRVRKALRLVLEEGGWKIAEERVVRALPE